MENNDGKMSLRTWGGIILFMFIGSLAGNVESLYFNTFLNDRVFDEGSMGASLTLTDAVNIMVALTATVVVITTFIIGTLSEKLRNRKVFISFGYIVWGITSMVFGFISKENVSKVFGIDSPAEIVFTTTCVVIVMNMIMAFLRSTSNDSGFNSWVTDVTTPENRPLVETIFTFMGFIAMGIVTVVGSMAQGGVIPYGVFFVGLGLIVMFAGIYGIRLIDNPEKFNEPEVVQNKSSYWADLFYGFRPSVIKNNSNLYLILSSGCLFNCAFQVFFPYLLIYLGSVILPANKDIDMKSPGVITTLIISILVMVFGTAKLMKKAKKKRDITYIISVLCLIVGLLILSMTQNIIVFIVGLAPTIIGYIFIMIMFGASVRDNIPQDKVGLFQGIRTIFLVLIPMNVGPTLGNIAAKNSNVTYMENGAEKILPTEAMFFYAAVVATLIFVPMLPFLKKDRERRVALETAEFQQRNSKTVKSKKQTRKQRKKNQNK